MRTILMFKDGRHEFMTMPPGGYGGVFKYRVEPELSPIDWMGSTEPVRIEPVTTILFRCTYEKVLGPGGVTHVYREAP